MRMYHSQLDQGLWFHILSKEHLGVVLLTLPYLLFILFIDLYVYRNCIGMNFAMAEMKIAVAMILRRYATCSM